MTRQGCGSPATGRCCGAWRARNPPGETLIVVRLDRLARSVSHLLADAQDMFSLQGWAPPRPSGR